LLPTTANRQRATRLLKTLLAVLFLGPLIAPLFQATGLPLLADSGAQAHDLLGRYICPTPAKTYMLLGFPMAVCARCWGATIGLWLAWCLCRSQGAGFVAPFERFDPSTRLTLRPAVPVASPEEPPGRGLVARPAEGQVGRAGTFRNRLTNRMQPNSRRPQASGHLRLAPCASRLLAGYLAMPWFLRLGLAVLALLLWTLEINAWPAAPRVLLVLNGAAGGFWVGIFLFSSSIAI
jgi:hypothetical protein